MIGFTEGSRIIIDLLLFQLIRMKENEHEEDIERMGTGISRRLMRQ